VLYRSSKAEQIPARYVAVQAFGREVGRGVGVGRGIAVGLGEGVGCGVGSDVDWATTTVA
jgi:hypothetical protein